MGAGTCCAAWSPDGEALVFQAGDADAATMYTTGPLGESGVAVVAFAERSLSGRTACAPGQSAYEQYPTHVV